MPGGKRAIATGPRGIGVSSGLHGTPIVARGHNHGIYPVHDPLIVRCSTIRIELGELRCALHCRHHINATWCSDASAARTRKIVSPDATPCAYDSPVGKIGKDP